MNELQKLEAEFSSELPLTLIGEFPVYEQDQFMENSSNSQF